MGRARISHFRKPNNQKPSNQKSGKSSRNQGGVLAEIRRAAQTPVEPVVSESFEEYVPINNFTDFAISRELKTNISNHGYVLPTPIQDQAIPAILDGKDIIGIANTGTGKTAAFLIPIIEKISRDPGLQALIITPTRELAVQIREELGYFSRGFRIRSALLIGGVSPIGQRQELRYGANVVIATPGRLGDFVREGVISLDRYRIVVLDEADRMVDIGFVRDIRYFISKLPVERQSLFFSATVSGEAAEILSSFVRNPVTVSVKKRESAGNITQHVVPVENGKKKIEYLHTLLNREDFEKVLIFGRTKWGIEKLTRELVERGFRAGSIHGNKRQSQRQRTLTQFKRNEIRILLATDVASRGLDIENVSHVINYDLPETFDDYVHRIGRTGRANRTGIALTFVDPMMNA